MKERNKLKKDDVLQQQAEIYEVKVWKKFWDEESPSMLVFMEQWRLWTTLSPNMFLPPPSMPTMYM